VSPGHISPLERTACNVLFHGDTAAIFPSFWQAAWSSLVPSFQQSPFGQPALKDRS
jgi:hypothetical protein